MNADKIMEAIRTLAQSQGFYGRLLESLMELSTQDFNAVMDELEAQHFSDVVDLVLFFEN